MVHPGSWAVESVITCLLSVGFLGLAMGAVLVNYMSFYVGTLLIHAEPLWPVLLLAWPPWAILRVFGFILAAIFLSAVAVRILTRSKERVEGAAYCLVAGVMLLVSDVLLKWMFAPTWRLLLDACTDLQ